MSVISCKKEYLTKKVILKRRKVKNECKCYYEKISERGFQRISHEQRNGSP